MKKGFDIFVLFFQAMYPQRDCSILLCYKPILFGIENGVLAQMVERCVSVAEVPGSMPGYSTIAASASNKFTWVCIFLFLFFCPSLQLRSSSSSSIFDFLFQKRIGTFLLCVFDLNFE